MSPAHKAGLAVMAGTWLICAGILLISRVRLTATLLAGSALAVGSALVVDSPSLLLPSGVAPRPFFVLAGLVLAPLAILSYPRFLASPTRHRVEQHGVEQHGVEHPWVDRAAVGFVVALGAAGLWPPTGPPAVPPYALAVATVCIVVLHLWWRFETVPESDRRPLVWLVVGLGTCAVFTFATAFALPQSAGTQGLAYATLGLPAVCMVVGVRRPDIVDATGIIVESAVFGLTSAVCVALYVTIASLLTLMTGSAPPVGIQGLIATVTAVTFHPVRRRLHTTVDELLFGQRPDPYAAAVRVAGGPETDAAGLLARLRDALVLPYAAIRTARTDGALVAESGEPTPHVRWFPLLPGSSDHDGTEGTLIVGLRPGDLQLSRADAEVLALVALLLGQILRAEALTTELSRSRAATREAVEEERRRLRRDLHDGLGPTLTGIGFTVDAVANLTRPDSAQVQELLATLRRETTGAIAEVRRIAYAIRPPTLDQLGLRGALAQIGAGLRRPGLEVVIEIGDTVGELPAATEVAAYRIVTEALTNAARHASARRVVARLTVEEDGLCIRVRDDAPGTGQWQPGVGLTSMRERAEELGGSLTAGPTAAGGRVEARLPIG